jgi:predicted ribosome quality control (RQC) complex YloA/Tae2 family protein
VRELWSAPWQPCLVFEAGAPTAFAPYAATHLAPFEPQPSISAALELFYAAHEQLSGHEQRRAAVRGQLAEAHERLDRQRRMLSEELARAQNLEHLRWEGEMIYGFLHTIQPGQLALEVEGQSIALDPAHTPVENAQARFHTYDKAKGAIAGVPERLAATQARLAGLDETLALLELAEGFEAIEGIAREAIEQGYLRVPAQGRKQSRAKRQPPLRLESSDGYLIYIGRSAGQNEQVTFKIAAPEDLWLHARSIPGAHVIIKSGGEVVPEQTLLEAAALAAYFSAGRNEAGVDVEIARRALVRRVSGGPPGLVTYRAERAVRVAPSAPQ